ncbi:Nodule Cysteine-Rich (NCR) secreted peptide, partial [Medicago truncatula]
MAAILKISYVLLILVSLIIVATSHSFLPCQTKDDCVFDDCKFPKNPVCYLEACHC